MSLEMNMLLQGVLPFLLWGAVVGPEQSLCVSGGTGGTCLHCECSHTNQKVASGGIPPCGYHTSSSCFCCLGRGLFAPLLLWGLCDSSWRAAFSGTALCLGPTAGG